MAKVISGSLKADSVRLGIVASRFNDFIVDRLVAGALDTFERLGGSADRAIVVKCPGAFEIPQTADRLAASGRVDAVVCLGCVLRGATDHYDHIAAHVTRGIGQIAMTAKVPVLFGVLTCDTLEQAVERAGTKAGNKGADAVMAALEMVSVYDALKSKK